MRLLDGWQTKTLGDVCDISSSKRIYRSEYVAEGIPFYRGKEIIQKARNERITETLYISFQRYQEIRQKHRVPKPGDILLTSVGTLGVPYVVKNSDVFYFKDGNLTWFRDYRDVQYLFLYYWLISPQMEDQIAASHIGVAQPALTIVGLKSFPINLPPLPTQRKIAAVLSAYDDLIENNTRRIAVLEEMARLLYREWFVRFRFPGHEDVAMVGSELGSVPEGWEVVKLGDIASINESSIGKDSAPERINYVNISSVSPGRIDTIEPMAFADAPGRARRVVQHGDVIWSCVRPNRRSYCLILDPLPDLIVSTGFAVITAQDVPYTYLYHALTTDEFVAYLTNNATGAAYPAVNTTDFQNADVLLPLGQVLELFHSIVASYYGEKQVLHKKNVILRRARDLLLPRLISGQVDVSELDIATETLDKT